MYVGVPMIEPVRVRSCDSGVVSVSTPSRPGNGSVAALVTTASATLTRPKSVTRMLRSRDINTLSGLKSRWTSPAACAAASPRPAGMNTSRISRWLRVASFSQPRSVPASANSIAR